MDDDQKLTVGKLMSNAERLFDIQQYRAAVMEAFTALEERVASVIFSQLENQAKLPAELIKWLKDKTQRSFDDRLHPIGAYALGKPIDKTSKLWEDYKNARKIRNKVSHSAKQVEKHEAETVLRAVREWLEYVQGAKESPAAFHNSEALRHFLGAYAVLMSRIRPRQGSKELSLGSDLADFMLLGHWEGSEETELKNVVQIRNRIAYNQVVSEEELQAAQTFLRDLLRRLKGRELG